MLKLDSPGTVFSISYVTTFASQKFCFGLHKTGSINCRKPSPLLYMPVQSSAYSDASNFAIGAFTVESLETFHESFF